MENDQKIKRNKIEAFFLCGKGKSEKGKGFTLIEFLMYISIVGIILVVASAVGFNVLFGKAKLAAIEEVSQNARFSLERIASAVYGAEAINSPVPGAASSALSLQMADVAKNPTIFDVSEGILRIKEGGGAATPLTSDEVAVSSLTFSNVSYANAPGAVRIAITLRFYNPANRQEYNFEKTFYTTANIHKK